MPTGDARTPLDRLIGDTRRKLRKAALAEAFLILATGLVGGLIAGAVAAFFRLSDALVATIEIGIAAAAVALVIVHHGSRLIGRLDGSEAVAHWLDRTLDAATPSRVLSAYELQRDAGKYGESAELGVAAIDRAMRALVESGAERIVARSVSRSVKQRLIVAMSAAMSAILVAAFAPEYLDTAIAALGSFGKIDDALERVPPDPRLGDIRVTLRHPAYTERPERTFDSPTGHFRALPGTEVTIETRARIEVAKGTLLVSHGTDGQSDPTRIAAEVNGRLVSATMVVSRSGRYRFELTTNDGELLRERHGHDIELELDDPPEVQLLEPKESPLEVNEHDRVPLSFTAKDDFAIGEISAAWRVMGSAREGRVRLTSAATGLRRYTGSAHLDLGPLDLKPGDRLAYSVEVRDNDTVNGPKVGASATKELRIYSKKVHHEQVLALQQQALDELVDILGDNLERALALARGLDIERYRAALEGVAVIADRADRADDLLKRTIDAIEKDPLGRAQVGDAFQEARRDLSSDSRRLRGAHRSAARAVERARKPIDAQTESVVRSQDRMVSDLEKNVVYLADLLNDQRMIDAEQLAKELREQQQALKRALEEYKTAPDDEKREAIAAAIEEIRKRIAEIMNEMARLSATIPQDFMNSDALQGGEMDEMERLLEEGDLEAALEELERMLRETERMLAQLREGRQELSSREYSEIAEQAQKLWENLERLEQDQRDLAGKTERMSKDILDRMKDRMGDPKSFIDKQVKRLEQALEALEKARPDRSMPDSELHELTERRVADGKQALEARDFGAAREVLGLAVDQMNQLEQDARRRADHARRFGDFFGTGKAAEKMEKELRRSKPIVEQVLEDIEKLMPAPDTLLSPEERQRLGQYQGRQGELEQRAEQLGRDLDALGQQIPIVGPEVKDIVEDGKSAMGQAKGDLGKGDAPSALSQERRALDALRRLKQELEKMSENGGGHGGVPLPFGQGQSDGREGEDGSDPRQLEKVEIPQPDQYKPPSEFREDILEAAKQGTVEQYKDAVRRYYEELVK
jgi:tetratricopeptide (TPR) repeat protein